MSIEEKYDEVRQLINIGKEKGYLLYDEVNELLPSEITSSDELDDLFNTFGSAGIEVIDSDQKYLRDEKAIDRTAGRAPKSSSSTSRRARSTRRTIRSACTCARWAPCRSSPARARSRSPAASSAASSRSSSRSRARRSWPRRSFSSATSCSNGDRTIRELVIFNDEEITDERIAERSRQVQKQIEAVRKAREASEKLEEKLAETPKGATTRDKRKYRRARWAAMRARVELSQRIREIEFTESVKRRLIDEMKDAVEGVKVGPARDRSARSAAQSEEQEAEAAGGRPQEHRSGRSRIRSSSSRR